MQIDRFIRIAQSNQFTPEMLENELARLKSAGELAEFDLGPDMWAGVKPSMDVGTRAQESEARDEFYAEREEDKQDMLEEVLGEAAESMNITVFAKIAAICGFTPEDIQSQEQTAELKRHR